MKKALLSLFLAFSLLVMSGFFFSTFTSIHALTITNDPQYVVMNFSTINELNWAAPEEEWQKEIKPQVLKELNAMTAALPKGTDRRRLAWSTLMEYMNFPLDEPVPTSAYVIKTRRIFEIADEENLPVFIPLNGFQWWDELPELYNWWDPDGTKTSPAFFSRQDNPEDFKRRFIAGYNPDNKWNVEWESWSRPMQLNWRNWGGGEFRLAPPPNLMFHHHTDQATYRQLLQARLKAILTQVVQSTEALEAKGKGDLFVGISLGTEISLNASATPKDEFMPYGYRALQDALCPAGEVSCLQEATQSAELMAARSQIVSAYLRDLSRLAVHLGIPKQRIYTHVWGEADQTDPKYAPYAEAAFNVYSRPGISLYGFAEQPYDSKSWHNAQTMHGYPNWGAVEYSVPKDPAAAQKALANTLNASQPTQLPSHVTVLYNWSEHKDTPAIPALAAVLNAEPASPNCSVPEIIPHNPIAEHDPTEFKWSFLTATPNQDSQPTLALKIVKGSEVISVTDTLQTTPLSAQSTSATVPVLTPGVYSWFVEMTGCDQHLRRHSEPRTFTISHRGTPSSPWLVKKWLKIFPQ